MIAKVGDDEFGNELRSGLINASINTDDVSVSTGVASGVALISVNKQGQNSIIVVPGANDTLRPIDLEHCLPHLLSAGIILTQLEIPIETVEFLCLTARKAQIPLILDPAPARALSTEMLRCITYLTPNETETLTLCGLNQHELAEKEAFEAAEDLLSRGAANIILKLGARGALIAADDGLRKLISAIPVPVVDSTAAGDAFNGALATALVRGQSLEQAVHFGIAVSALSVTRAGAQTAMPHAQEVAAFLHTRGASSDRRDATSLAKQVEVATL